MSGAYRHKGCGMHVATGLLIAALVAAVVAGILLDDPNGS